MHAHDPERRPAEQPAPWFVQCVCALTDVKPLPPGVIAAIRQAFEVDHLEALHADLVPDAPVDVQGEGDHPDRLVIIDALDPAAWAGALTQHPDVLILVTRAVDGRLEYLIQQLRSHQLEWAPIIVFSDGDLGDAHAAWLADEGVEDVISPLPGAVPPGRPVDHAILRRLRLAVARQRRRRSELESRQQDARQMVDRLERVLHASVDPIVVVNREGYIRFANQSASEFFDQPLDHMMGMPFGQPIGSDPMQELDVVRRDGAHLVVEMRVVNIEWEGKPAMLATLRDITERKRLERNIRDYADQLGLSNRELKRFIYLVSEDLRSPLMTILGYASQMKRPAVASDIEKVSRYSDRVALAAQRGLQHLGALLDYGRIAEGSGDLQPVDVSDLVRTIHADLRAEVEKRGVRVDIEPSMPMLLAHREHIADLFRNLLENAIQHGCTDNSDPRVWVGAVKMEREVRYFVKDNGPGIPAHHHRRVFDLFEQFGPLNVGAGVGLAIVKRVANIYSGRAWVESKPGEGATFWISIPTLE